MQMFKKFDLSMFFDISTTKSVDKNKLDFVADGEYDFIGRTSVNWGIQGKLHKLSFEPNPKDSFSLIQVGETVALWREKEWYASQNLFLLNPKIDDVKENKLYFQGVINKEMSRYGKEYSSYPTMKSLEATKILLPVIESPDPDHEYTVDDIDWQYMRKYIAELEKERIAELDAYLAASGLNDYELTDKDKETLSSSTRQMFKSFYLKDIFGSEPIRGTRLTKEHRISGNIPLITAGEQNEGVAEYISNQENQTLSNMLTIDMFGNCFYRDYLYKSDDNILSFGLNGKSTEEMLYIASIINSICKKQYNYARQYRKDSYLETTIPLPVIESPDPDHKYTVDDIDFDYMERYIRATEKSVIADVVRYKNKVIEETKKTVNAG